MNYKSTRYNIDEKIKIKIIWGIWIISWGSGGTQYFIISHNRLKNLRGANRVFSVCIFLLVFVYNR